MYVVGVMEWVVFCSVDRLKILVNGLELKWRLFVDGFVMILLNRLGMEIVMRIFEVIDYILWDFCIYSGKGWMESKKNELVCWLFILGFCWFLVVYGEIWFYDYYEILIVFFFGLWWVIGVVGCCYFLLVFMLLRIIKLFNVMFVVVGCFWLFCWFIRVFNIC